MRILFICKNNESYGHQQYSNKESGLFNSTRFIVEALNKSEDFTAKIVDVIDNNDIDREVAEFHANIVVIEALWVVPEKFDELKKLHPHVKWFVHLHSNIPFLALEGIAIEWIYGYAKRSVGLISNSHKAFRAIESLVGHREISLLPNVYTEDFFPPPPQDPYWPFLDVGCFGAIRPFKNHLIQAMAAIRFAKELNRELRFHVNAFRLETGGDPVLRNLIKLFDNSPGKLVPHKWFPPKKFVQFLHDDIDIGMQVSLSETFNVVTADYVTAGLPVVVSKEIYWVDPDCWAEDDSLDSIVNVMRRVYHKRHLIGQNQGNLCQHSERAINSWVLFFQTC